MIKTQRLLKVSAAWISIVYVVCFVGVALFMPIRPAFMMYGLHMDIDMGRNVATFGMFLSGLVIWNVITYLAVWLFATLYNSIKK